MDPADLEAVFRDKPALHRYPASMAKRAHDLCRHLVEHYDGRAEAMWTGVATGDELLARVQALPGFGKDKARIFVGLLGKRLGVRPPGWEQVAADWAVDRRRRHVRARRRDPREEARREGREEGRARRRPTGPEGRGATRDEAGARSRELRVLGTLSDFVAVRRSRRAR